MPFNTIPSLKTHGQSRFSEEKRDRLWVSDDDTIRVFKYIKMTSYICMLKFQRQFLPKPFDRKMYMYLVA